MELNLYGIELKLVGHGTKTYWSGNSNILDMELRHIGHETKAYWI